MSVQSELKKEKSTSTYPNIHPNSNKVRGT